MNQLLLLLCPYALCACLFLLHTEEELVVTILKIEWIPAERAAGGTIIFIPKAKRLLKPPFASPPPFPLKSKRISTTGDSILQMPLSASCKEHTTTFFTIPVWSWSPWSWSSYLLFLLDSLEYPERISVSEDGAHFKCGLLRGRRWDWFFLLFLHSIWTLMSWKLSIVKLVLWSK